MEFRKANNCDELCTVYRAPEVLSKYYVGGVCGFDKEGFPVWLDPFTRLDTRGILHSATKEQVLLHKLYSCEQLLLTLKSQTAKMGKPIDQINIIYDVAGLSWHHLWPPGIDCFKTIIAAFEDNYPELLRKTYIINAPRLFVLAYNMLKGVISPRTREKVVVLGAHWKEALLKNIEADQIPVSYGGTQVDENGDPLCSSKVLYGGEIPKSYYVTNEELSPVMQSVHIPSSSHKHIEFEISVPKCQLRYTIKTDKHDIAYGVLYKPIHGKKGDTEVFQEVKRVNTHLVPQTGSIECQKMGTYIMVFDNSFSWTKGKTVKYAVEIVPADDDNDSFSSALDFDGNEECLEELLH
ncbi:SEC14-like protein 2 isoform X2 [Watersipora subatra]